MKKCLCILACLLFISSCTLTGTTEEPKLERDIYKGTQGVILDNSKYNLPQEVYEGEQFTYALRLENKGPYEVNTARLLISLDKGFMEFNDGSHLYEDNFAGTGTILDGKTIYYTADDFLVKELLVHVKELDALSEYHDSTIQTLFCYDYNGIAFADVCIDTDPHNLKPEDKSCTSQSSISLSEGQGGPVVISRIEPRMLINNQFLTPQFKIYFQNHGQGTVISPGKVADVCNNNALEKGTYNTLSLKNVEFSNGRFKLGQNINCIPSELVLRNEEDMISCTVSSNEINRDQVSPFMAVLKVEYEYGYTESSSDQIRIKDV
ncbi:hypothetical protein JXC34_01310 [Candidatus Woesearchaeota archaeon]|nr:hypothetical protein [Candidatus Woesearchaeota archaeon]